MKPFNVGSQRSAATTSSPLDKGVHRTTSQPNPGVHSFEAALPEGKEWFSIRWLARHWGRSVQHIINLVDSGEIETSVDMRGKGSRRSDINVPRSAVVNFLNRRSRK